MSSRPGRDEFIDLVSAITSGDEPGRRFTAESLRIVEEARGCPEAFPGAVCRVPGVPQGATPYAEAIGRRGLHRIPAGTPFAKANETILESAAAEA